ncbi:hypothetical protein EPUS_05532 [Endocarpon pusillum Z07020]|uniref:Peptidase A1 domain-containing protein n=1 Tax=Endocarpon pusillum (strain Z07020 / HMAS-L-300199) TaxID=1263415 RepID=U1G8P3_ENDPU|nr:uncharacterized protein EPUS_05532 [Endocarpon pusillum Z07020]ERF73827.1 hypothetical protein EPUS_05532 [Endocarpon pusillum Z07020]
MILTILATFVLSCVVGVQGAGPVVLPFNETHYFGFDGPWQAVPIMVGRPQQLINLYPGGNNPIVVLSKNVVQTNLTGRNNTSVSGVYDASLAETGAGSSQVFSPSGRSDLPDGGWGAGPAMSLSGSRALAFTDDVFHESFGSVKNTSLAAINDTSYQLPDGRQVPLDVGFLSLGGEHFPMTEDFVGTNLPLDLSSNGLIQSNTWGLHIGSVHASIPGSLVFGGYDMARVISDINTAQSPGGIGELFISLLDISIGVAKGGSPFSFRRMDGLLQTQNSSITEIKVRPNPTVPYLHLPGNTCDSITAYLPVGFVPSLGLYIWNTDSPQYRTIISSPAFLAFTFKQTGSLNNFTINVPFFLLNLTLTPPLVEVATPCFPCRPFEPNSEDEEYHLGRAFLQAAFIGMNWSNRLWWMAQAPGPRLPPSTTTSLENLSSTITAIDGQAYWTSSWDSVWTPLAEHVTGDDGPQSPAAESTSLSAGVKAGIVIGAIAGAATFLVAIFLVLRRHRKRAKFLHNANSQSYFYQNDQGQMFRAQLPSTGGRSAPRMVWHEMPPGSPVRHEMPVQPIHRSDPGPGSETIEGLAMDS